MSTINSELQNKLKKAAAVKAADYVKDGMIVGLGSGSTVTMLVMSWDDGFRKTV